jgi:hypothetical protein
MQVWTRWVRILAGFFLLPLLVAPPASAQRNLEVKKQEQEPERRVALVIGNSTYKEAPLANPVNDAVDIAAALDAHGFKVIRRTNASQREMRAAVREFGTELRRAEVGLFYFAGHGLQVKGSNFLIPVDAEIQSEADAEDQSVDTNYVLRTMEDAQVKVSIIILDACRNNPFGRGFRSLSRGLAQMSAATGSIVAFSTAPGSVAADGAGRNGIYTKHLLASLKQNDSDILRVFQRTRAAVVKETAGRQTPWESTSLIGDFRFRSGEAPAADAPAIASVAPARRPRDLTDEELARHFDAYVRYLRTRPPHAALAVAKDPGRWVWDGRAGFQSPDQANREALANCARVALERGVKASCQLHPVATNWSFDSSDEGFARQLDLYTQYIYSGRRHAAVAVAKDRGNWVWGGWTGASTPEAAQKNALAQCTGAAVRQGLKAQCQLHFFDGILPR